MFPRVPCLLISLALLALTGVGNAQTIAINDAQIERSISDRTGETALWISYDDCTQNDQISFPLEINGNTSGHQLEVWVGTSEACTQPSARSGNEAGDCWLIYREINTEQFVEITLSSQAIAAYPTNGSTTVVSGSPDACEDTAISAGGIQATVWFMLVNGTTVQGTEDKWETTIDLVGPAPPDEVAVRAGENRLSVRASYDTNMSQDLVRYQYYCVPAAGGTPAPEDSGAGSGGGGTDGGADAAAPAAPEQVPALNPECPAPELVPGSRPSPELDSARCGTTNSLNGGTDDSLENGVVYALAMAGTDESGNRGPLSEVACGTPVPITDFYEHYRNAGGKGGGGFCGIGRDWQRHDSPLLWVGLITVLGTAAHLRRRKSNRR